MAAFPCAMPEEEAVLVACPRNKICRRNPFFQPSFRNKNYLRAGKRTHFSPAQVITRRLTNAVLAGHLRAVLIFPQSTFLLTKGPAGTEVWRAHLVSSQST